VTRPSRRRRQRLTDGNYLPSLRFVSDARTGSAFGDLPFGDLSFGDLSFGDLGLLAALETATSQQLDELSFGLVVMDRAGTVTGYNTRESAGSGLDRDRVLGRDFFVDVGPCTNNYLVAERFHREPELDEQLDYVFTFRMKATPVRLRLLAAADSPRQYLAVRWE
jgi:photoactive yellow protein